MRPRHSLHLAITLIMFAPASLAAQDADAKAKIKEAMSAGPHSISADATVIDSDGTILKQGTNGWTCIPTPPQLKGTSPMCLDAQWAGWAGAWQAKLPVETTSVGIAYMLAGDEGASNTDPYAEGPTDDNDWVVAGPHLMVIVPDGADLEGMTDDPSGGGPWVMWKGTPYVHIMVPVELND